MDNNGFIPEGQGNGFVISTRQNSSATQSSDTQSPSLEEIQKHSKPSFIQRLISNQYDHSAITPEQWKTMSKFTSIDYNSPSSEIYKTWVLKHPDRRIHWDRWFLMVLLGLVIGLLMALMSQIITLLFKLKINESRNYLEEDKIWLSWIWITGLSLAFCIPASILTLYVHPPSMGSGIPEVIAFLNGIMIHGTMCLKNIVVKFIAVVLSVSSGLPCAVYGPVVAIGAAVGKGVGQFESKSMGCHSKMFDRFRNAQDRRTFTTAGVAAGLAAAFNAPIGGLCFAMEESASHWTREVQWQTLFSAAIAASTANLINQAFSGFEYKGSFGLFTLEIIEALDINVIIFVPVIILGILGGLFGALYARLFALLAAVRKLFYGCISGQNLQNFIKILETALVVIIMASMVIFLPETQSCTSYSEVVDVEGGHETRDRCTIIPPFGLETSRCPEVENTTMYNELRTMVFDHPSDTLKKLQSRNTQYFLSHTSLWLYFPFMYFGAIWTSQVASAGGIFLQVLTAGAILGRSLGLLMLNILKDTGNYEIPTKDYWQWMDPGLIAILGSAAMLAGITRFPLASALITVEMSRDIHMVVPILICVSIAKQVGDIFSKHFYRYIFRAKCLPYLDQNLKVAANGNLIDTDLYRAGDVMAHPVHIVHSVESIGTIAKLIVNTEHSTFPVVKISDATGIKKMIGNIKRQELILLLCDDQVYYQQREGTEIKPAVSYKTISQETIPDEKVKIERIRSYIRHPIFFNTFIDLQSYINVSASKVERNFSLSQTYTYFCTLGLRHLTVTDEDNQVCGVITRKDLQPNNIYSKLTEINNESLTENNFTNNDGVYRIDINNNRHGPVRGGQFYDGENYVMNESNSRSYSPSRHEARSRITNYINSSFNDS